jgi:hypothetical protein
MLARTTPERAGRLAEELDAPSAVAQSRCPVGGTGARREDMRDAPGTLDGLEQSQRSLVTTPQDGVREDWANRDDAPGVGVCGHD